MALRLPEPMLAPAGDRSWVKTKNHATARFAEEREGVGGLTVGRWAAMEPTPMRNVPGRVDSRPG